MSCAIKYRFVLYLLIILGLAPEKNSLRLAIADGIVDQIQDLFLKIAMTWIEENAQKKVN